MKRVGLTGGIGMGKSAAAGFLEALGVACVDTDVLARELVAPGQAALEEVVRVFGPEYLTSEGGLDRGRLGRLVFGDEAARLELESILHPRIRTAWKGCLAAWEAEGLRSGVVGIPLLFESGVEAEFDVIVCVACRASTQRERLLGRGLDEREMEGRIWAQWPVEKKMVASDRVLWSEGTLGVLEAQVGVLVRELGLEPGALDGGGGGF